MVAPELNTLQALTAASADQLKQIVQDEPYFGAAQFILARKLYASRSEGFTEAIQQAALHFSDHLWLNYQLHREAGDEVLVAVEARALPAGSQQLEPGTIPLTSDADDTAVMEEEEEATAGLPGDDEAATHELINDKLSSLLQQQAAMLEKPVDAAAEIVPEPVAPHRIDYFESQGIKLDEEKNDKLGGQLRRFTDWLKQMKRINPNPTELKADEAGEIQVQHIARHSNETQEVVTETMAEVLVKQGKLQQAMEIYEKLSFNNPSKSVYFAAKIEELKGL